MPRCRRPSLLTIAVPAAAAFAIALGAPARAGERPPKAVTAPSLVSSASDYMAQDATGGELVEGLQFLSALSEFERAKLKEDRMVFYYAVDTSSGESVAGKSRAIVLFEQPKERAFKLLSTPRDMVLYTPSIDGSDLVRLEPDGEVTLYRVGFLFWDIEFFVRYHLLPERDRIEWEADPRYEGGIEGGGSWQFYALGPRYSVGEYIVWIDTGLPLPERLIAKLQRGLVRAFKRYVDSDGEYRRKPRPGDPPRALQ